MGEFAIKNVYVLSGGSENNDSRQMFQKRFINLFPCLDISSEIYYISEDVSRSFLEMMDIAERTALFLNEYSFYRINVHPVHPLPAEDTLKDIYNSLFRVINPFNREGYLHQNVPRFMILPILMVNGNDDLKRLAWSLDFFRERMMVPSIYIPWGISASGFKGIMKSDKERVYIGVEEGLRQDSVIRTLGVHSVFDGLLEWADSQMETPVPGCQSIVLRKESGSAYNCFLSMPSDDPSFNLYSDTFPYDMTEPFQQTASKETPCLHCAMESISLIRETLNINDRERELGGVSFHVGTELVKEEDYGRALQLFDKALSCGGTFEEIGTVLISKALCHIKKEEMAEAEAALDEAEKHMPPSGMIYYYKGMCEFGQRDYIEAIDRFHDALRLKSDQLPLGDLYFHIGLSHIFIEEYDDGLTMMSHADKYLSHKSIVYYYMGVCHLGMKNLDTALDYLHKAHTSDPLEGDLGNIFFYLGHCYKEMERYEEAIRELERAREADEKRTDIYNLLGFCHFKLKEHERAIECFQRAIEIDPTSAIDYANMGVNLREIGRTDEAVSMFKKALLMDPTIGFAAKHLTELEKEKKDYPGDGK